MGYQCDSQDGMAGVVLVTLLGTGDTLCFCANCAGPSLHILADTLTPPELENAPVDQSGAEGHSNWDGPRALDVYPAGDPRNETDDGSTPVAPVKAAPRKRAAKKPPAKVSA